MPQRLFLGCEYSSALTEAGAPGNPCPGPALVVLTCPCMSEPERLGPWVLAHLSLPGGQHAPRVGVLPQEPEWQDPPTGVCFPLVSLQFPCRMVVLGAGEGLMGLVVLDAGEGMMGLVVLGAGEGVMDPGGSECWRRDDGPW